MTIIQMMRAGALAVVMAGSIGLALDVSQAQERPVAGKTINGPASWYGGKFHGRKTANGERYNMNEMTAAHKTLPFGTKVRVTNQRNGRSVIVRINDRGPFVGNRVIDLSRGAAAVIDMIQTGVVPVRIDLL
ncbi:MAG: septal ring lytic transglycosylase RlpA family protein [Salinarimonadaceae bacterium]|nr:MAG: septal ring lytic transglycosylase RlpA family protein [Salinarimonadaceae bacterium]